MASGIVTKVVGDGNSGTISHRYWCPDTSASPQLLFPAPIITDTSGNPVDFTAVSPVSQSGTWTVQPGNTANTTAWKVDGSAVNQPVTPLPATPVSGLTAAMTGTTSTAVTGVGATTAKNNYITGIVVGNSHATVGTFVELQDGSGGTTFFTLPAAAVYGGAVLAFPTPLKQPTANTALYCKNTTTGANVIVSVSGFQA